MITLLFFLAPAAFPLQDPAGASEVKPDSQRVEALRERIHDMRTNLVLGGENVRRADSEAIDFYEGKTEIIEQRLDQIGAELTERRATYEVTLDRALRAASESARRAAMQEASSLRAAVSELESESADLTRKRADLLRAIEGVRERERERSKLAAQLETATGAQLELGLPVAAIGLAPEARVREASAILDDETLVNDLLERDPRGARRILFEADPVRYWRRFPLRPPADVLWDALAFPQADLPGQR